MDGQHKILVNTAYKLQEALRGVSDTQEIDHLFSDLISRTRIHFQEEEKLMQTYNYPEYSNHKKLHDLLLQQVEDSKNTQRVMVQLHHHQSWMGKQELADYLGDWLMSHILEEDNKLGHYLCLQGLK